MEITLFLGIGTYSKLFKFMLRQVFIFLLFVILFVLLSKPSFAVTLNITNYPNEINLDSFSVTASITGAATGTNYLRVDLYKNGSDNYFGETYNGSDWYNGSDGLQYFSIPVVKGSTASATIQAKVGNPNATEFPANGAYKLKLRRYTSSGSLASTDTQTSVDVQITIPTPTPTPTQVPVAANTPVPTSTPSPTRTPTPSPTKSPTPTLKPTSALVIPTSIEPTDEAIPTSVLGESTESEIRNDDKTSKIATVNEAEVLGVQTDNLSKILISIGVILLLACGILFFRTYMLNKKNDE